MANRKLVVEVVGDASKLDRTFKQAQKSTDKFGRSLEGLNTGRQAKGLGGLSTLAKSGGIAIGLGIAAQQARVLSDAASDLNEQISKSRQVFGQSSSEIEQWSKTTARSLGISRTEALEATGTFGNLFATIGLAPQRASELSRSLTSLAADLASFNNADPSETLDAIRSGLIGEAEPLRRFGVLLSEARVQQQAMADTGKKTAASLTDQEKTLARYELIMRDTVKAQGDFARTSGGLANQQRILKATLADTRAELGTKLLPAQIALTKAMIAGIDAAEDFARTLNQIKGPSFVDIAGDITGPLARAFGFIGILADDAKGKVEGLTGAIGDVGKAATDLPTGLTGPLQVTQGQRDKLARDRGQAANRRAQQSNTIFDNAIARALFRSEDLAPAQQIRALREIEHTISDRIAITKDITRKLNLEDELIRVRRQRRGIEEQLADEAKDRQRKVREAAQREKDILRDIKETLFSRLEAARAPNKTNKELTKTRALNSSALLRGLGLDPAEARELRSRLSKFTTGGTALAGTSAGSAFGFSGATIENHVTVLVGGKQVEAVVTKQQQKRRQANPLQKRGAGIP